MRPGAVDGAGARTLFVCHQRPSRRRARAIAVAEAMALLADCGAETIPGGPLSEQPGVFWITLENHRLETALPRLPRLGYTVRVDLVEPEDGAPAGDAAETVRWKGRTWRLRAVYREDTEAYRRAQPDQRAFLLAIDGRPQSVRGYRGDGSVTGRRGLPVEDARLLVNLAAPAGSLLLDPFAGAGGVLYAAVEAGLETTSGDIDPFLRFGLHGYTGRHVVADARALPFRSGSVPAIATEPPYAVEALPAVSAALAELARVLVPGGRIAMLCGADQRSHLSQYAAEVGLESLVQGDVDRKGTACAVLVWRKAATTA